MVAFSFRQTFTAIAFTIDFGRHGRVMKLVYADLSYVWTSANSSQVVVRSILPKRNLTEYNDNKLTSLI